MHIGILQTGHAPDALIGEHGDYSAFFPRLLRDRGLSFSNWPVVDGVFPPSVHDAEGWLITGSRHGAYDDLPWIARLEDFIRTAYAEGVPMVGICFGHQVIAQALGGKVEKYAGGWAVGPQAYRFSNGLGEMALNAWHQDQVTRIPEGAKVVAENDFCRNAALIYDDRAYTLQPHPEFASDFVAGLIATRGRGLIPDPLLDAAEARLHQPLDADRFADSVAAFFKQPRAAQPA